MRCRWALLVCADGPSRVQSAALRGARRCSSRGGAAAWPGRHDAPGPADLARHGPARARVRAGGAAATMLPRLPHVAGPVAVEVAAKLAAFGKYAAPASAWPQLAAAMVAEVRGVFRRCSDEPSPTVWHDRTGQYSFSPLFVPLCEPPTSRWSYGLLGSLGRRHAQTPRDFGLTRPRNVRCHQGHWSWSWPVWPLLEGYRVENPILQETELGEFLSHIVREVCVSGLLLSARTHCVLALKSKPNAPTPRCI
jgi:hypothetical protein